jgi:hypothetical protein
VHRKDQNPRLGEAPFYVGGRLDAIEPRHVDIHQRHVGPLRLDQLQCLPPVGRFGDDLDSLDFFEKRTNSIADQRMVVRKHNAYRSRVHA